MSPVIERNKVRLSFICHLKIQSTWLAITASKGLLSFKKHVNFHQVHPSLNLTSIPLRTVFSPYYNQL